MKTLNCLGAKVHLICVVAILVTLIIPTSFSHSQPPLEPIYVGREISPVKPLNWSNDSKRLAFQIGFVEHPQDGWVVYDVDTTQLTSVAGNPSLPVIPPTQADALRLPAYQSDYFQASPNGRYVVYPAPASAGTWQDGRSLIALTDLQLNETQVINLPLTYWFAKWSEDSTAFSIETGLSASGTVAFFFNTFATSVRQVTSYVLGDSVSTDRPRDVTSVYDISSNGQKVLINVDGILAVWEVSTPSQFIRVAASPISMGAAFSPDEQEVFYATRDGVYRYNLNTKAISPLLLKKGSELLMHTIVANISPDGKRIAVLFQPTDRLDLELYVIETELS